MPKCEICEKKVKTVFRCKECSTRFCKDCGSEEREMCEDCVQYEDAQGGYEPDINAN